MRPVASVLCCYLCLGVEFFLPVSLLLADCVPSELGFIIPIVSCQPAPCGVSLPSELLAVFGLILQNSSLSYSFHGISEDLISAEHKSEVPILQNYFFHILASQIETVVSDDGCPFKISVAFAASDFSK